MINRKYDKKGILNMTMYSIEKTYKFHVFSKLDCELNKWTDPLIQSLMSLKDQERRQKRGVGVQIDMNRIGKPGRQ